MQLSSINYLYIIPIAILFLAFTMQEAPVKEELELEKALPELEPVKITPIRDIIPVREITPIDEIVNPPVIPRPPRDMTPL